MDLKTRKLNIIEYVIQMEDENMVTEIETLIYKRGDEGSPFTKEQLIARAQKSKEDYLAGRVISHEELERESKKW